MSERKIRNAEDVPFADVAVGDAIAVVKPGSSTGASGKVLSISGPSAIVRLDGKRGGVKPVPLAHLRSMISPEEALRRQWAKKGIEGEAADQLLAEYRKGNGDVELTARQYQALRHASSQDKMIPPADIVLIDADTQVRQ
jgi:hypothetical protein